MAPPQSAAVAAKETVRWRAWHEVSERKDRTQVVHVQHTSPSALSEKQRAGTVCDSSNCKCKFVCVIGSASLLIYKALRLYQCVVRRGSVAAVRGLDTRAFSLLLSRYCGAKISRREVAAASSAACPAMIRTASSSTSWVLRFVGCSLPGPAAASRCGNSCRRCAHPPPPPATREEGAGRCERAWPAAPPGLPWWPRWSSPISVMDVISRRKHDGVEACAMVGCEAPVVVRLVVGLETGSGAASNSEPPDVVVYACW
jgi:hypothetical protein